MAKRIVLNIDICCGCRSCEAACKSAFKSEARIKHADIVGEAYVPLACKHCKEPNCAAACPVDAIIRDEESGLVQRSSYLCIGCQSCAFACPFGVIDAPLVRHVSQKCSLCEDREEGPRCVAACSSGALLFVDEDVIEQHEIGMRVISKHAFYRRSP